ncbi:unnamed protein product [Ilex paraguariensis]|uniref:SAC domain-containing protein n=1 Tax=Ilex paraguariensis TaxID=185542 RepID=A0ABC8T6A1_9AQUA
MMEKADPAQKLYTRMRLWEFPDQYVIEPTDGSSGPCLAISRVEGSTKFIDDIPQCSAVRVPKIQTIFGVIGMLKLLAGSYLIVVAERECVGSYLGHPIFKVSSLKIFPCDHSLKNSPDEQKRMENEFSRLLNVAERTPGLYFSYDVNITLSAQRLHDLGDESKLLPLWRQADPRFLWNNYMLEVLIDNKLDPYLLPVVQGNILFCFQNFQAAIGKDIIDVMLIARRCTRRTGTRMWRRGADSDGYVANFVESEQIVQLNGYTASFLQVRGSIPLLWDQIVDLKYKPKFEIVRLEEAPQVVERHFLDLRKKYGNVLAADLVNKHGGEGRLCEQFSNAMQHVVGDDVRYLHFDFHRICGHVHFERLSILYDQIEDFLIKNRYLLLNEKGEKVEGQLGVVRTNCIDCLDRTNVTQSMIGRKMLEFQLRRLGIFEAEETIGTHPNFDESFKILWANHGDEISIQYSGTPALKGDFVRCGQRTIQGILKDGWNALMRYYLNNFCDGTKQDAIDLLQGHYIVSVSRDMAATSHKGGIEAIASFPLAFSLIMAGFFFAMMSLRRVRYDLWHLLFSFMWASLSLAIAAFVKANGRIFCNRPRLHTPRH